MNGNNNICVDVAVLFSLIFYWVLFLDTNLYTLMVVNCQRHDATVLISFVIPQAWTAELNGKSIKFWWVCFTANTLISIIVHIQHSHKCVWHSNRIAKKKKRRERINLSTVIHFSKWLSYRKLVCLFIWLFVCLFFVRPLFSSTLISRQTSNVNPEPMLYYLFLCEMLFAVRYTCIWQHHQKKIFHCWIS